VHCITEKQHNSHENTATKSTIFGQIVKLAQEFFGGRCEANDAKAERA